jgi:hypothetical protein
MKVLNLVCANHHLFEGWFASEDDYQSQGEAGLLACPMCADTRVNRLPSAPRISLSRQREEAPATAVADDSSQRKQVQSDLMRVMRRVLDNTEDVGERFPEEARRIHYGEAEGRGIRGRATREEAAALVEEGIEVVAVELPPALKGPTH